ncbi:helix-turn-helix domain-containing protein [Thalassotalea ponticola]|uniref:MarR family transcriptional regulator n=1 Tax=Thalassotalea ponticola TaxID=1523392 RepID=UPI0025B51197|nr:helix-turn-helix domain-containing protein [Thalassotalea ponticola]MDN3651492.1 helix-turn-helix domain-containing protein [Thalassotalea ponticola]
MIYHQERGIPQKYQKSNSTQARHNAKQYSLLDWIYRFGFTSVSVIELLWDVDRSVVNRMVKRLVKDDVINEVATYATRDKRIFLLKPKAVRMLEELHNEQLKYNIKPSTINPKSVTHDLITQAIVAIGIQQEKYAFFITEREQEKDSKGKKRRVDAICYQVSDDDNNSGEVIAIEVECSSKTIIHRLDLLRRYKRAIESGENFNKVLVFSHRRRFVKDAERVNTKLIDKPENELDREFFSQSIKYIYSKELISILYNKFW